MLHSVCGNQDIADVQTVHQAACHTCVNHTVHIEAVNHRLRADSRVHLTDAAHHQHDVISAIAAMEIFQPCGFYRCNLVQFFLQVRDFFRHRANNANRFHATPPNS